MPPATLIESLPEFRRAIAQSKLSVVDFFAVWCGPCKAIAPRFEQLAAKFSNVNFYKVNVDNLPEISKEYGVTAMPTFKIFRNNKLIDTVIGADIAALQSKIQLNATQPSFSGVGQRLGSTLDSSTSNSTKKGTLSPPQQQQQPQPQSAISSSLIWLTVLVLTLYWWNLRRQNLDASDPTTASFTDDF